MNDTTIINKVFLKGGRLPLSSLRLAMEAGRGFKTSDFPERISGSGLCDCVNGGEFELLPEDDPQVIEGGKRYMQCRICSGWSHL